MIGSIAGVKRTITIETPAKNTHKAFEVCVISLPTLGLYILLCEMALNLVFQVTEDFGKSHKPFC